MKERKKRKGKKECGWWRENQDDDIDIKMAGSYIDFSTVTSRVAITKCSQLRLLVCISHNGFITYA
jgi:hypothetical protein